MVATSKHEYYKFTHTQAYLAVKVLNPYRLTLVQPSVVIDVLQFSFSMRLNKRSRVFLKAAGMPYVDNQNLEGAIYLHDNSSSQVTIILVHLHEKRQGYKIYKIQYDIH